MLLSGIASICFGLYLIQSQLEPKEACQWVFGYGSNMNEHHVKFKKELNISGGKNVMSKTILILFVMPMSIRLSGCQIGWIRDAFQFQRLECFCRTWICRSDQKC